MHRVPWWKTWGYIGLLSLISWGETGCSAVMSDQVRQQADRTLAFGQFYAMPEAYIGRTLILGGYIVRIWNVPGETCLDVLQRLLDAEDRPILTQQSEGRFLVRCDQYLDPFTYTAGRMVTVAGRVLGTYTDTVGERDTVYPLLACVELYLWPLVTPIEVYPSVRWWWEWDPWYWEPWPWLVASGPATRSMATNGVMCQTRIRWLERPVQGTGRRAGYVLRYSHAGHRENPGVPGSAGP